MKNINRQTHIFIFELVIAIAFFALASSICVQFFVKAHSLSKETNDINISMNLATGYVEEFLNDPTIYQVNQEYIHYYDENWKNCHKKNSTYFIKIYCSSYCIIFHYVWNHIYEGYQKSRSNRSENGCILYVYDSICHYDRSDWR